MIRKTLLLVMTVLVTASCYAFADTGGFANRLAEKGIISYEEAQAISSELKEEIKQMIDSEKSEAAPKWVQNMTFKGDIKLRVAQYDWTAGSDVRIRERLRLRMGVETKASEKIKVGFGFATGALSGNVDANANSSLHTFQYMDKSNLFLDHAYIQYDPYKWLTVRGGKVKGATKVWNPSDLIWDLDYNPDGLNATASTKLSDTTNFSANTGLYTFGEVKSGLDLPSAFIAQPVIEYKKGDIKIKTGLAYQQFNFKDKYGVGTKMITGYNYAVINPSLSVDFNNIGKYKLSVFGDYAKNTTDSPKVNGDDASTGYLAGISFGSPSLNKFGTWTVKAMYRYLEKYAIPEGLGDSSSYGAKAGKGYKFTVKLGLTKALTFGPDYYQMTNIDGNVPKSLIQFDFDYKF